MRTMRFFGLIVACLLYTQAHAGWVKVAGKVVNPMAEVVEIVLTTNYVSKQEKVYTAKLNGNGEFSLDMEIFMPQQAELRHAGYFKAAVVVMPGEDFTLSFDCVEFRQTLGFGGKGGGNNNFMNQYFTKYESNQAWDYYLGVCKAYKFDAFRNAWLDHIKEELAFLEEYGQKVTYSAGFKEWMSDHIRYKNANQMWDYQFNHAWENGLEASEVTVPRQYFTYMANFKPNNDYMAGSAYYNKFLDNYIWHQYNEDLAARGMEGFEQYNIRMRKEISLVRKHLTGYAKNKQYSAIMFDMLKEGETLLYEEYSTEYAAEVDDEHLEFIVTSKHKQTTAQERGEFLPEGAKEITVIDADGNTVPLRDILSVYQGKVVYIDFWASWCGPCLKEMPSSAILQDRFAGKDVVFLYMANDEDVEAWKQAISKHHIVGEHIFMNRELFFAVTKTFGIEAIPHYALVDKKGNIYAKSATNPSNPKTTADIEKLLAE